MGKPRQGTVGLKGALRKPIDEMKYPCKVTERRERTKMPME